MRIRFVEQSPKPRRKARAQRSHIAGFTGVIKLDPKPSTHKSRCSTRSPTSSILVSEYEDTASLAEWFDEVDTPASKTLSSAHAPTVDLWMGSDPTTSASAYQDSDVLQLQHGVSSTAETAYELLEQLPDHSTALGTGWDERDSHLSVMPFSLSHGVQYLSHVHKAGAILDMYNQEFCVLPLTMDCPSNPFRVEKHQCESSDFLLHAVMALSAQHLAKKNNDRSLALETQKHQATAIHLFSQALEYAPASRLLDTLLILVNFEATQTASSSWAVHLNGAKQILDGIGVAQVCEASPKGRPQIAMLVWWDVTLAFISRRETKFPTTYLEQLINHEQYDEWSFFALSGCPAELVLYMARLSKLASVFETVINMEHTSFNTEAVDQIMLGVRAWANPENASLDEVEQTDCDTDLRRNKYHCIEAWRHSIVLYCYRVFFRPSSTAQLRSIAHLARVILDHVRCIPQTEVMQKQTLLPVFLAAAEAGDESTRSFARQYCSHWSVTARYHMFATVESLLEDIWADWNAATKHSYWWGTKVGGGSMPSLGDARSPIVTETLLG
ncbi:hypothetical protein LTR09_011843 [Extremus antarcticus]|uniref:Transcription factor domain-containing protein n=1 Tax=Extremus antarcticus TaxID=702011 RepID=A0AAJ0DB24_9PEZI|nr:hypothetical protein LTR09_011843 [Extremus antarcticus]